MFKKAVLFIALISIVLLAGCTQVSDVIDEEGKKMGEVKTTVDSEGTETSIHIETVEKGGVGSDCEWDGQCKSETEILACLDGTCKPVDCKYSKDCPEGYALCMTYTCLTEEEVADRFETWDLSTMCPKCENCKHGIRRGSLVGKDGKEFQFCYDCESDTDCKEGYHCEVGLCVQ